MSPSTSSNLSREDEAEKDKKKEQWEIKRGGEKGIRKVQLHEQLHWNETYSA